MNHKKDHQLVQQVLDGSIGQKGFMAFQERLRREPELVGLYRQYALLHHVLCEEYEGQLLTRKPVPAARRLMPVWWMGLAAAAVIALLVVVQFWSPASRAHDKGYFATAGFSEDAVWEILGKQEGSGLTTRLAQGAIIRLQQGQARVTLKSGAVAVIDGDTELGLVADDMLRLDHGRGRFRLDKPGGKLTVTTSSFSVMDLGTEFGMESHAGGPDEVQVFEGRVELRLPDGGASQVLAAGDAARVNKDHTIERIPVTMARMPKAPPRFLPVFEEHFEEAAATTGALDQHHPKVGQGTWRVTRGNPTIAASRLEGADFEAFFMLPGKSLRKEAPVLLATMETLEPLRGKFHTDGWAGMSFYQGGKELLFFGDGFGPEPTWSLDVKQDLQVVVPKTPLTGPHTVTLCYHRDTGAVSLHVGSVPLGPAFCAGKIPPGLEFDEIRIGASEGASLALRSLTVRAGDSSEDAN